MTVLSNIVDIHSHILPGIDDGADTFEDSIRLARELVDYGVTDIITTPHFIMDTNYASPKAKNLELVEELNRRLVEEKVPARVYLGNEIYMDEGVLDLVESGVVATMADSKYILVEFSLNDKLPNCEDYLEDLIEHGYKVILAHPERYSAMQEDYELLEDLYDMGVLFQCNLGSIDGRYGTSAKKLVKMMAKDKMIWTFSSDLHHLRGHDYAERALARLGKLYSDRELTQLMCVNPRKILG